MQIPDTEESSGQIRLVASFLAGSRGKYFGVLTNRVPPRGTLQGR